MWHVYNLITEGDEVRAPAVRSVGLGTQRLATRGLTSTTFLADVYRRHHRQEHPILSASD